MSQSITIPADVLARNLPKIQDAVRQGGSLSIALPQPDAEPAEAAKVYRSAQEVACEPGHRSALSIAREARAREVPEAAPSARTELADAIKAEAAQVARRAALRNLFTFHPPTSEQVKLYELFREAAFRFALVLDDVVPNGADKSAAIRKLREAVMTGNAGIALSEGA